MELHFALARLEDLGQYVTLAVQAQAHLQRLGLSQWVPAAHPGFLPRLRDQVAAATLHRVLRGDRVVAFFNLTFDRGDWWLADQTTAAYLTGIVVARAASGTGVGAAIIDFAGRTARARDVHALRLDCHEENKWLCNYYESHGFRKRCRIEQHSGYMGALYEKHLRSQASPMRPHLHSAG